MCNIATVLDALPSILGQNPSANKSPKLQQVGTIETALALTETRTCLITASEVSVRAYLATMEAETSGRRMMLPTMSESLFKIRRSESQRKRDNRKVIIVVSIAALAVGLLALGLGLGLSRKRHGGGEQ